MKKKRRKKKKKNQDGMNQDTTVLVGMKKIGLKIKLKKKNSII